MGTSQLTCHGGAGTVTGANFLLEYDDTKVLVDCGIHEREEMCDPANYGAFPYDPKTIDVLFITHAHADHIGRVPKLVRDGFRGVIYSTPATKDLSALMFEDALNVMRQDMTQDCGMLYEAGDVAEALFLWKTHEYHAPFTVGDMRIELLDAGHILGSAMVSLTRGQRTVMFTGDLGNSPEPLLNDTESPEGANYLVMESVYGDRVHEERAERLERLKQAIQETRERKGVLLIPSFSLERTQILLFEIYKMAETGALPAVPVYLDSPLAIRITEVFRRYKGLLNPAAQGYFEKQNLR